MSKVKHRMIVEKQFSTAGMTKTARNELMKKFFSGVQKCMKHHADTNDREVFTILITAKKAED